MSHQCKGKKKHPSKEAACIVARRMKNCTLNVYLCPECHKWHLGRTRDILRNANRITQLLERAERDTTERIKKYSK
jgi:hypothetical protein